MFDSGLCMPPANLEEATLRGPNAVEAIGRGTCEPLPRLEKLFTSLDGDEGGGAEMGIAPPAVASFYIGNELSGIL